jgi:putative ABC transport system permease protein
MWRAVLKGLLAHKVRLALTSLAIVLGVGFISGTYVLTDTMNKAFDRVFAEGSAGIDVLVRAQSENEFESLTPEGVSESLLEDIERVDGVLAANGTVQGYAQLVAPDGEAISPSGPPTLGVSWTGREIGTSYEIRSGRAPATSDEIAIDVVTFREHDFELGDRVPVLLLAGRRTFELVGTAGSATGEDLDVGATVTVFDLDTAQRVRGSRGSFTQIEVAADEGLSAGELRDRLAGVLPDNLETVTAASFAAEQSRALQ